MVARMGVVGVAILGVVALGGFVYLFFLIVFRNQITRRATNGGAEQGTFHIVAGHAAHYTAHGCADDSGCGAVGGTCLAERRETQRGSGKQGKGGAADGDCIHIFLLFGNKRVVCTIRVEKTVKIPYGAVRLCWCK